MRILAELTNEAQRRGQIWIVDDYGDPLTEKFRCLGEADNQAAQLHANPAEDPRHPFGDHPSGVSLVSDILTFEIGSKRFDTYGPLAFTLDAIEGQALLAKQAGRTGIWIHGGRLGPGNILRPTYGCLRVDDSTMFIMQALIEPELKAGRPIRYEVTNV